MVEARMTRGAARAVETPPSATAAAGELVRSAVREPSSLRRRPSAEVVHGAATAVGVAVVGGQEKGGKSPCLAILVSLHHAYAPLIIVPAVDSSSSSSSSSATNASERMTARRRRRRERETITSLAGGHCVLRKLIRFRRRPRYPVHLPPPPRPGRIFPSSRASTGDPPLSRRSEIASDEEEGKGKEEEKGPTR